MGETGLDSFLVGFRLGAKMIFDTFLLVYIFQI